MLSKFILFGFILFVVYAAFKLGKIIGRIPNGKVKPQPKKQNTNIEEAEYKEL